LTTDDYPMAIENYGKYIGLIGQINNDIKDIGDWNEKNDLMNKKYSLPIIYLMNCQDEVVQLIRDYYDNKRNQDEIVKNQGLINQKFVETGAITYTEVIKKIQQNKAIAQIRGLNIDPRYIDQLLTYIY
jgi:competence protein ComQ